MGAKIMDEILEYFRYRLYAFEPDERFRYKCAVKSPEGELSLVNFDELNPLFEQGYRVLDHDQNHYGLVPRRYLIRMDSEPNPIKEPIPREVPKAVAPAAPAPKAATTTTITATPVVTAPPTPPAK